MIDPPAASERAGGLSGATMKTFAVYSYESEGLDYGDFDDDTDEFVTFDLDTIRALRSITSKKGAGPEIAAVEEAWDTDALSSDQVDTIRRLETEFAREIAEFKASRRPMREAINDGTPAAI